MDRCNLIQMIINFQNGDRDEYNSIKEYFKTKIAISICTLFVLPAKISELDLKYMSRLGLAYSF